MVTQDNGARALAERLATIGQGPDGCEFAAGEDHPDHHGPEFAAAILANGAAFLEDAAELGRLRAALEGIVYANHPGESSSGGCLCAAHEDARAALSPDRPTPP